LIHERSKTSLALGVVLAAAAGVAAAQPAPPASDAALAQSMAACGEIANVQKRVACYDALNRRANPAATPEAQVETRRRDFGFRTPKLPNPLAAPKAAVRLATARPAVGKDDGVDRLTTHVDHTRRSPTGQLILVTAEGAVWMLDDNSPLLQPAKGAPVLIRRGSLGSLFCDLDRSRAIRCRRLE